MTIGKLASRLAPVVKTWAKTCGKTSILQTKPQNFAEISKLTVGYAKKIESQSNNIKFNELFEKLNILKQDKYFKTTKQYKNLFQYKDNEIIGVVENKYYNKDLVPRLKEMDNNMKTSMAYPLFVNKTVKGTRAINNLGEKCSTARSKFIDFADDFLHPTSKNKNVVRLEEKLSRMGVDARFENDLNSANIIFSGFKNMQKRGIPLSGKIRIAPEGSMSEAIYSKSNPKSSIVRYNKSDILKRATLKEYLEIGCTKKDFLKWFSSFNKKHIVYHETGHTVNKIPLSKTIGNPNGCGTKFLQKAEKIMDEISYYGATSPDEFCAEVFAGLMSNKKYSSTIMKLYKNYGGFVPK